MNDETQLTDARRLEKEEIEDLGTVTLARGGHVIHCLTVIGQIEGHSEAPQGQKTTKYEHVIPQLVAAQEDPRIEGLLVLLNTVGGDVEAGLALAELIASGVTTIADMYMHTPAIAETVLQAGISANLSCGGVYFGAPADFSPKTCNDCGNQIRLTEEWHGAGDGQILVDASIHAEYTSSPCGSGWPSMRRITSWACTSTSPRPSTSTRPARSAGA